MSVTSGFFNSLNGDRKYNATSISKIFDGLINDGIYMSVGNAFLVNASSGMNVIVKPGRAWFNHTWTLNDSDLLLTIDPSELLMTRIDAVVLEVDNTDEVRGNTIKIVKGAPAEVALKPALTNTEDVHQYALAYITVDPKVTAIDQAKIENAVGTKDTPYVNAIVKTIDTSEMYAQFTAQFNTWFENIQDSVSDNAVLDLAMKIADLTKTDNSVPTLLYRYVLFPETLTEAEKTSIESNTDLMTLVKADKRQHVQIGNIIMYDTRSTPPDGYLRCTGGIIQAADFPEYSKSLGIRKHLIRRTTSGGRASGPWYENSGAAYYTLVADHCTCGGYTVALVAYGSTTDATSFSYAKCMVFNPKGTKIYSNNFGASLRHSRTPEKDAATSVNNCAGSIYFEDENTVIITCANGSSGAIYVKLIINGDTVTLAAQNNIVNDDVSGSAHLHIPNTNKLLMVTNNRYTSMSNSGTGGSQSNSQCCSHYKIVDEITGSGSWNVNVNGTRNTDPWSLVRSAQDRFLPCSNRIKYTTAGMFASLVYGYLKVKYGESTATVYTESYSWADSNVKEGDLIDVCAKKGDWFPLEKKESMFNIKTNEIKSTSDYGFFIGTMIFGERKVDLYIRHGSAWSLVYLKAVDSETDEVLFTDLLLNQWIAAYKYKANAANMSAKNFIIIGHKLFIVYPLITDTASPDYIDPTTMYKEYYEISLDEVQLPLLTDMIQMDPNKTSEPLIRVK